MVISKGEQNAGKDERPGPPSVTRKFSRSRACQNRAASNTEKRARWHERLRIVVAAATRVFSEHAWLAGTVLVMAVWTVRQLVLHYTASGYSDYISDQVGGQNLMAAWQQGFRQGSAVPADNFFLKYPLYLLGTPAHWTTQATLP